MPARESDAEALLATRFGLHDLRDIDWQELLLAQELADLARGIPFDDTFAFAAGRVDGRVFEGAQPSASADKPHGWAAECRGRMSFNPRV